MSDLCRFTPPEGATLVVECPVPVGVVRKFVLANGLTVVVLEDRAAPVAAYQTWFAVGSGHEARGKSGIAHLFEHLMFKETRTMAAGEFDRILEANGVSTNAATWLDWTYYRESLPADKLALVVRLEADRMENMILGPEQVATEKEVVKNERLLRVDNDPDGKLYEMLYHEHFSDHPYGHPTIGWMQDIEGLDLADCIAFHRTHYCASNATIVVVGDVDTHAALELVMKHYGHLPAVPRPAPVLAPLPVHDGERRITFSSPVAVERAVLLHTAPPLDSPECAALGVLSDILFNCESSRIRRLLLDERELATDVLGQHTGLRLTGTYEVQFNMVPGRSWEEALELVDGQVREVAEHGCTQRELETGINKQELSFLRLSLSVGSRARSLGHFEVTTGDFRKILEFRDQTRRVTVDDVRTAARRYLDPARRTVAVAVSDGSDCEEGD
jgi:zinc protease